MADRGMLTWYHVSVLTQCHQLIEFYYFWGLKHLNFINSDTVLAQSHDIFFFFWIKT